MDRELEQLLEQLLLALERRDEAEIQAILGDIHPADLAEMLNEMPPDMLRQVFSLLPAAEAAVVIEELSAENRSEVLTLLETDQAAEILDEMAKDEVADLLAEATPEKMVDLLSLMQADEASDVQELLAYLEDSAGGIMTTEFVAIQAELSADEAIATLRRLAPEAETIYYVYVVDHQNNLVGVLSLRELIVAPPTTPIADIMQHKVICVEADTDQEEVARVVAKYDLLAVPVVDNEGRLLGIITVDDVIDVIEAEASEDIARSASVDPEEQEFDFSPWERARKRLPWLIVLLFGGLLASRVIDGYQATLQTVTALALFITVMAGEAGNAGTQSLTLVVRGIATGSLDTRNLWRVVGREAQVGLFVGVIVGPLLGLLAWVWQGSPVLGLVVGATLWLNITVATVLGSFVPIVVNRLGLDPAVASGPFMTTLTDVISMLIYFGLATFFLSYLL